MGGFDHEGDIVGGPDEDIDHLNLRCLGQAIVTPRRMRQKRERRTESHNERPE